MARGIMICFGLIFLIIGFAGYTTPISVTLADTTVNITIPKVVAFCDSGIGQFSQMLAQVVLVCSEHKTFLIGIYGSGLVGIILVIVGAVTRPKKSDKYSCQYCNFVGTTEGELLKHKAERHLEKSPYTCGHCDFVGNTEEVLWNHYDEKHPNEKKW